MSSPDDLYWVKVVGLTPRLTEDDIAAHFQTARCGSGLLTMIVYLEQTTAMVGIEGLDSIDTKKLTIGSHVISGVKVRVTGGQVPSQSLLLQAIILHSTYATAPQVMQRPPHFLPQSMTPMSPVVRVVGIKPDWDEDMLAMAFDDEDEGGGEIEENGIQIKGNEALITFKDPDIAQRVSMMETWEVCDVLVKVLPFQRKRDTVQAIAEKCTPDNTIVIEDIPEGMNEEYVKLYLEKVTKLDEEEFTVEQKGTKALLVLQGDVAADLEDMVTRIQSAKKLLKGTRLKAARLTPVQSVLMTNLRNEVCREDKLKLYFKNKKKSGGGKLQDAKFTAKGQAVVTFLEPEDVEQVLARNHSALGKDVELQAYHPILSLWYGTVAQPKWANSKKMAAITRKLSRAQYEHMQKCNLIQVINDRLVDMKLSAEAKLDAAEPVVCIEPTAGSEYDEEWSSLCNHALQEVLGTISEASVKILEDHQLAYKESLEKHGSVELEVTRCVFVGSPAVGKSSLKHLLVHNTPKAVKTSTAVMEMPEVVTEQYAVGEFTSAWQLVTDDVMEKSLHECIMGKEYDDVDTYPELLQPVNEETAHTHASKMARASEDARTVEHKSVKNKVVSVLEEHHPILPESTLGAESVKLQRASFIHLLDTGGQPSFQDALPLLLDAPCTYIQVFNAARDLDQPVPITYRSSDKGEVEEDEQFSAETGWEMMLRSFSGMQTMAHKCSKEMVAFQQEGSQLPKLRIFVVGTYKDQLVRDGEERKAVQDICRHMKELEGKPYYRSIQRDSSGQLFYLLSCLTEEEDEQTLINCLRKDISNAGYSLKLKVPLMWFYCKQFTQRYPRKFLRFQDLKAFCLKQGYIDAENAEKQFLALLHLFSLLGFYSFFSLRDMHNESNFVCTDTGVFLMEVSKLLAIQHRKAAICYAAQKFQQYGIISSDEELFKELHINKEVDQKWFLGALEHLGLLARYADSGNSSTPFYFMPIALPQEKTRVAGQGTVASLCVTFEFPAHAHPLVDTDLPRGVFCQLAVKLSKGPWRPFPKASNRTTVKFQSGKFDVYLREAPGFISLTPILMEELDGKEPVAELHKLCRELFHTFSKSMESAAEDVLGVQDGRTSKIVFGFECCCNEVPHLATLATTEGKSLICPSVQRTPRRDSKPKERIWFSSVNEAMLVKHRNMWIIEEPFDSTRLVTVGASVGPETDDHEYKEFIVPSLKMKPPHPCTQKADVLDMVARHKKEINAMLNHPSGGTVHFGIRDDGNIVEEGLDMDPDDIMDDLQAQVGQIVQHFFPAVGASFWSVEPVNLRDYNGKLTGRWRFDICVKPHAHALVWLARNDTKAYYRQGACSHPMPADMLAERIKGHESVLEDFCWIPSGIESFLVTPDGGVFPLQSEGSNKGGEGMIQLHVPKGAVRAEGKGVLQIRFAVIADGPFRTPEGYKLCSVAVYLHYNRSQTTMPFYLHLPHWSGSPDHPVFVTSPHTLEGERYYLFRLLEGGEFGKGYGLMEVDGHCSLFGQAYRLEDTSRYYALHLQREEGTSQHSRVAIIYESAVWIKILERYWKKWQHCGNYRLQFKKHSIEGTVDMNSGRGWCASTVGPSKVSMNDVEYKRVYKRDALKEAVIAEAYPPSITVIALHSKVPELLRCPRRVCLRITGTTSGPLIFPVRVTEEKEVERAVIQSRAQAVLFERDPLSQPVHSCERYTVLFRECVSRQAAGKGKAILEYLGLDTESIELCYQSNPRNEEEAVQDGLKRWRAAQGDCCTWQVLLDAVKFAGVALQDHELVKKLQMMQGTH